MRIERISLEPRQVSCLAELDDHTNTLRVESYYYEVNTRLREMMEVALAESARHISWHLEEPLRKACLNWFATDSDWIRNTMRELYVEHAVKVLGGE